jgi:hypothetical protein
MPEKVTKKKIDETPARPEVLPPAEAISKPKPVELEFDESRVACPTSSGSSRNVAFSGKGFFGRLPLHVFRACRTAFSM